MKPGDKVVCVLTKKIKPSERIKDGHEIVGPLITDGTVYVISSMFEHPILKVVGLSLIGHTVICKKTRIDIGWNIICFRSLEELKQESRSRQQQAQPA